MRTDPRAACANENERAGWAFVHDLITHPLMALTGWARWSLALHDWTSHRAWPRPATVQGAATKVASARHGVLSVTPLAGGLYRVKHGTVDHAMVLPAISVEDAAAEAVSWFDTVELQSGHQPISVES